MHMALFASCMSARAIYITIAGDIMLYFHNFSVTYDILTLFRVKTGRMAVINCEVFYDIWTMFKAGISRRTVHCVVNLS